MKETTTQEVLHDKTLLRLTSEGRVEVYRFLRGEVKPTLKELAAQHGFAYEEKWNTRHLGAKMIDRFGDGHEARIGSYFFRRLESGTIDGFEIVNSVKDELHAVAASLGVSVDSTKSLEELAAQLIAASPATSSGTASASVASAEDAASTRAAEIERFFEETGLRLPDNLVVEGDLDLSGQKKLTTLPAGLTITGDLVLEGCVGIKKIPADLKLAGSLSLSDCESLATPIPKGLCVGGDLYLKACGLCGLPSGLSIGGSLILSKCWAITGISAGISIGGDLRLGRCDELIYLPPNLHVPGDLVLWGCPDLTVFPLGLHIGGDLMLDSDYEYIIPDGVQVGGVIKRGQFPL